MVVSENTFYHILHHSHNSVIKKKTLTEEEEEGNNRVNNILKSIGYRVGIDNFETYFSVMVRSV